MSISSENQAYAAEPIALSVPGATLNIVRVGPERAPPLVLLHGGPGEAHDYLRPHCDRLASSRRSLVYYDQRGGGLSALDAGSRPVGWEGHVADLEAIRAHLGEDRIDLLGFSWGALLALLYAIEHPTRVHRLVLVAPASIRSATGDAWMRAQEKASARPEVVAERGRLLAMAADASDPEAARRARFALKIASWLADPSRALAINPVDTRDDVAAAVQRSLGTFDLTPKLRALRSIPSLVARGEVDPAPLAAATEIAEHLGARLASIPRAGHAPFVEPEGGFFELIESFLDSVDRPAALR